MERTIAFYKEHSFPSEIRMIEDYDKINTFSDLLNRFKGRRLYIDIWGTTCAPCRKELKLKEDAAPIFKKEKITSIFILLGDPSEAKLWKGLIANFNLHGYHMMANELLMNDLLTIYKANRNSTQKRVSIPWNILVDENGKIVDFNAKRPSEILETQSVYK